MQKERKRHIGLKIFLVFISLILALLISLGVTFALTIGQKQTSLTQARYEELKYDTALNKMLSNSIDKFLQADKKVFDLNIPEDYLNARLAKKISSLKNFEGNQNYNPEVKSSYLAKKNINDKEDLYINSSFVKIYEESFDLITSVSFKNLPVISNYNTYLTLNFKYKIIKNEDNSIILDFKLNKIYLGKVRIIKSLAKTVISKTIGINNLSKLITDKFYINGKKTAVFNEDKLCIKFNLTEYLEEQLGSLDKRLSELVFLFMKKTDQEIIKFNVNNTEEDKKILNLNLNLENYSYKNAALSGRKFRFTGSEKTDKRANEILKSTLVSILSSIESNANSHYAITEEEFNNYFQSKYQTKSIVSKYTLDGKEYNLIISDPYFKFVRSDKDYARVEFLFDIRFLNKEYQSSAFNTYVRAQLTPTIFEENLDDGTKNEKLALEISNIYLSGKILDLAQKEIFINTLKSLKIFDIRQNKIILTNFFNGLGEEVTVLATYTDEDKDTRTMVLSFKCQAKSEKLQNSIRKDYDKIKKIIIKTAEEHKDKPAFKRAILQMTSDNKKDNLVVLIGYIQKNLTDDEKIVFYNNLYNKFQNELSEETKNQIEKMFNKLEKNN